MQGSISSSLLFTCYGLPATSTQLELVRGRYRPVAELCQGRQIRVAFNQYPGQLEVDMEANKILPYPLYWSAWMGGSFPSEILDTFFKNHQLSPVFINNGGVWGHQEAGEWIGAVGMVRTSSSYGPNSANKSDLTALPNTTYPVPPQPTRARGDS